MIQAFFAIAVLATSLNAHAQDRPVAVQISIVDESGVDSTVLGTRTRELEEAGYKVFNAAVSVSRAHFFTPRRAKDRRAREALLAQIKNLPFAPEDKIEMLVVSSHGGEENDTTQLTLLGNISEAGLDEKAKETFGSLVPHAAEDMRIVLVACSTFCGKAESTAKRARAFLNFFGATKGSLFGAKQHVLLPTPNRILPSKFQLKVCALFYMFSFLVNMVTVVASHTEVDSRAQLFGILYGNPAAIVMLGLSLKMLLGDWIVQTMTNLKFYNQGNLYLTSGNSEKIEIVPASFITDNQQIFKLDNASCNERIQGATNGK